MAISIEELERRSLDGLNKTFVPFFQKAYKITTEYGAPIAAGNDAGKPHYGLDFGTPKGTPLYSMGVGIVRRPTQNPDGTSTTGKDDPHTITIDYGNGITVQWAHLDEVFVRPGDAVKPGDFIGKTGDAGISTGAHAHVTAWKNGNKIDVRELIDPTTHFENYAKNPGAAAGAFGGAINAGRGAADSILGWGEAIVAFVTAILNPETWARVFAILAGALLTMVGGYMLWQST